MFKVTLSGSIRKQFFESTKSVRDIVDQELTDMARKFVAGAQRDAPANNADLRRGITFQKDDKGVELFSNAFYSAFMEFGTKGKYRPIPGEEEIAQQFKGLSNGDFSQMIRLLTEWVRKKGITGTYSVKTRRRTGSKAKQADENQRAAWAIAISILKHGVSPHPFFFKQLDVVWPEMVANIEKRISASKVVVIPAGDISRPNIITI
jgi:hypothetical protein